MQIVHLVPEFPSQINRGLAPLVYALPANEAKLGHRVHVFAFSEKDRPPRQLSNFTVCFVKRPRRVRHRGGQALLAAVKEASLQPDIVHSINLAPLGWRFSANRKLFPQARFVLSLHTSINPLRYHYLRGLKAKWQSWEFARLARYLAKNVDLVLPISQFLAHELEEAGITKAKIQVIPTGFEADYFPFQETTKPHDPLRLLYIGRFSQVKNLPWLISSLAKQKNIQLTMIGGQSQDDDWQRIRQTIEETSQQDRIQILPPQPNNKLIEFLRESDAFIMPSAVEGLNKNVLEAMAAGTLVLSSGRGGLAEIVHHNKTGLQFDINNPTTWHDLLNRLAQNRIPCQQITKNAHELSQDFSFEKMAERYLSAFSQLIKN